jgi:hypothetical protein
LGPHSYDPGVSRTLVTWTIEIPDESVEINLDIGEAVLRLRNVRSVFDAFTVPNSLSVNRSLGLVGATINSLRIHWTGIQRMVSFSNATTGFAGNYVENSAVTLALTVTTPSTTPPFTPAPQDAFQFVSDPATTIMNFAQLGRERNGLFFPG